MAGKAKRRARRERAYIERLPSGTWRARVRGVRPDGRPFDRSVCFSQGTDDERRVAAQEAKATLWRWAQEVEAGLVVEEESVTLSELVTRFRREGLLAWRPADASALKGPLRSWAGVDVREMTDARWRGWVEVQKAKGRSPAYIRGAYSLARRVVGLAVERRILARLPWVAVARWLPGEKETHTRRALEASEVRAILDAARELDREGRSSGHLALRLEVAHHTAARPLELARWGPRDLVAVGTVSALRWQALKGGDMREVPLPEPLAEALRAAWNGLPAPGRRPGVFFPLKGKRGRWGTRTKRQGRYETGLLCTPAEIAELRRRSAVSDFSGYLVRHTGATDAAAELGLGAAEVKALMGHRTLRMTSRYVAGRMTDDRAALLARPRSAASAPTAAPTVLVVHDGAVSPGRAESHRIVGEARAHEHQVRPPVTDEVTSNSHGRGVGAEELAGLRAALPVLRDLVASAGGAEAWSRVTDLDPASVLSQVTTLLGAGLEGPDRGLCLQVQAACHARAHERAGKGPQKAGERSEKVQRFRVVK